MTGSKHSWRSRVTRVVAVLMMLPWLTGWAAQDAGQAEAVPRDAARSQPATADAGEGAAKPPAKDGAEKQATDKKATNKEVAKPRAFRNAVLIKFDGEINPLSEHYLYRKLDQAKARGADLVIVEIASPGGYLQSSLDMANRMRDLDWAHTVAYVPEEAYSGAAILSLGCDEIILHPNAQFGDAGPIFQKGSQFHHAPEKVRSVLVSAVRGLAKAKGRPPALAQAMVDMDLTVYKATNKETGEQTYHSKKEFDSLDADDRAKWELGPPVLETQGKLFLTLSGKRCVELSLAESTVDNSGELLERYQLSRSPAVLEYGAVDTAVFVLNLPLITGALFVVGLIALYFEMSAPGISIGGLIAGLCFVLFFWSRFLGGTSGWLEILLFASGLAFLAAEIFVIPGFGVAGVTGLLLMAVSLLMASQDFVIPETSRQLGTLSSSLVVLVGSVAIFMVAAVVLSRYHRSLPVFNRLVLAPPSEAASAVDPKHLEDPKVAGSLAVQLVEGPEVQVGDWGVSESPLRPAGKVLFGEEYVDVVTDGTFIEKGQQVRIVRMTGNRIVVREVGTAPPTPPEHQPVA